MEIENQQQPKASPPSAADIPSDETLSDAGTPVTPLVTPTADLSDETLVSPAPVPAASMRVGRAEVVPAEVYPSMTVSSLNANRLLINYLVISLVFLGIGLLLGRLIFAGTAVSTTAPVTIDDDPIMGAADAPITIIEFSDFNCPFCGRFSSDTLPLLLEKYEGQVRFVYRDMPIIGGQISVESAVAAECAADQGEFTEYHDRLYNEMEIERRTREVYIEYAAELGLNEAIFSACLDDPAKSTEVTLDYLDGQEHNITGTPTFYINGRMISGAHSFEVFSTMIDREIERAGINTTGAS